MARKAAVITLLLAVGYGIQKADAGLRGEREPAWPQVGSRSPRTTSPGSARRGVARQGSARPGPARQGAARQGTVTTYRVNWRARYLAEHRHVQRLLDQLEHARHVQAAGPTDPQPPHYQQWLCIHSHEASWDAATGNGYYGGLQMDMAFQAAYAPDLLAEKGTADHWTPLEQMQAAERAWRERGFTPWPNTARMCGLL